MITSTATIFCIQILTRPDIALHKKGMESKPTNSYVKFTQKDYSLSFKLNIVQEADNGKLTINGSLQKYGIHSHSIVLRWIRKYGTFDR